MTSINLIPPEELARRDLRRALRQWSSRLGFTAAIIVMTYAVLVHLASAKHSELTKLASEYSELQTRLQRVDVLLGERDRLAEQRTAIERIRSDQAIGRLLHLLEDTLPRKSYLSLLDFVTADGHINTKPGVSTKQPPIGNLRIRGWAPGHEEVGAIIRGMNDSGVFGSVVLASINEISHQGIHREVEFEITCTLLESSGAAATSAHHSQEAN